MGWKAYFESVIDNPYLDDFYTNMNRWSFNLQIYFLAHRFRTQKEIIEAGNNAIQDRTIYEDVEIFARSLYEQGYMTKRDHACYQDLFYDMVPFLPKPNLIIYLQASNDILMERIKSRGRDFEQSIKTDYIEYLNRAYDEWIEKAKEQFGVLEINTDDADFLNGDDDLNELVYEIKKYCP